MVMNDIGQELIVNLNFNNVWENSTKILATWLAISSKQK